MTISLQILLTILLLASAGLAQTSRDAAATNPLDSARFLLAHDEMDFEHELPEALFASGQYEKVIAVIPQADRVDGVLRLVHYGRKRLSARDRTIASKFAVAAYEAVEPEPERHSLRDLIELIKLLAGVSRNDLALKIVETQKGEIDNEVLEDVVRLAAAYLEAGDPRTSRLTLERGFELIESDETGSSSFWMADVLLQLGDKESARRTLEQVEQLVRSRELEKHYLPLGDRYLSLGDAKKAESLWKLEADDEDTRHRLNYASILIQNGRLTEAEPILRTVSQDELDSFVVKLYLQIGRFGVAEKTADAISSEDDNYDQQSAYMEIADIYIKGKQHTSARRVLEKAFKKAKRITFADESEDSEGASSGSRKWIYLTDIGSRFEKIGDTEKALAVINELRDPHPRASKKLARGLADFAQRNAKRLSAKRIDELFASAFSLIDDDLDEDEDIAIRARLAEVKALLGHPLEASNVLAELLEKKEDDALIRAGEVFAIHKLPLTDRLQLSLTAILEKHGL